MMLQTVIFLGQIYFSGSVIDDYVSAPDIFEHVSQVLPLSNVFMLNWIY